MAAQTSTAAEPALPHRPPPPGVTLDDEIKDDDTKEEVTKDDIAERSLYPDHDDVQAVLQPAMSRAASHLTSIHTPAVEKVAAMERMTGFFDGSPVLPVPEDSNDDDDSEEAATPKTTDRKDASSTSSSIPRPFNPQDVYKSAAPARTPQTKGALGSALASTRHRRAGSAGQDALKRFQKALPSFGSPSSFLPSLPTKYFNNLADSMPSIPSISIGHHTKNSKSEADARRRLRAHTATMPAMHSASREGSGPATQTFSPARRPGSLRRTTSDESILYHTLSRQSSLGDDDRFQDVREMVNMRLLAFKDSLPDVPNFKIPSLAKLQATARRSQQSLNGIFSNDSSNADSQTRDAAESSSPDRETKQHPAPKDDDLGDVLRDLVGDIVILGGYRGSVLRSADPPHHQLWAPVKLGLGLRKADLEVGLDDADEESMPTRIIPSGMLKNIGPIDVSRKLFRKLQASPNAQAGRLRVWDFGYDWRLSPRRLSSHLQEFLAKLPSNQAGSPNRGALVIAHSLGGLITRHAVNARPELFSGVLYAGVPHQCMNILGPLRNGDAVLFNEKLLTARVNFSIRTSFALLPEDSFCFVDKHTGEPYPVDFLDPMSWVRHRLSPCLEAPLPPLSGKSSLSSPSLASFLPHSFLRPRGDSKAATGDRKENEVDPMVPSMTTGASPPAPAPPASSASLVDITEEAWLASADDERRRNYAYLKRTLAETRLFRAEMRHSPAHQAADAYPPLAVLYGKTIPTVCAAGVDGVAGIARSDAYDDLAFRSGDGVALARESMLPPGYALVRGGRVSTERGHITLLSDMPALARALRALARGRGKGIGLGGGASRRKREEESSD
ncbi:hypothetical protein ISF_08747 [Cordyceps fumosorosea ARSEF 2679]|uniref:Phosphatidylcholine-sterol O-acyltransferase-like protein n=1 Tax=Cordyceps fumosorosea (strain ARSEF 2679) TaxID=1081104 RepID=A0A167LR15_CORFA|nr:hypothetical protein ISF_08747 [Cordyceps fumosorosea ARSEF 2679]OAA53394.1 hypothetical protein ISF_08747 [Cordyceps fumosorosea ARSEF 2679]